MNQQDMATGEEFIAELQKVCSAGGVS